MRLRRSRWATEPSSASPGPEVAAPAAADAAASGTADLPPPLVRVLGAAIPVLHPVTRRACAAPCLLVRDRCRGQPNNEIAAGPAKPLRSATVRRRPSP